MMHKAEVKMNWVDWITEDLREACARVMQHPVYQTPMMGEGFMLIRLERDLEMTERKYFEEYKFCRGGKPGLHRFLYEVIERHKKAPNKNAVPPTGGQTYVSLPQC